MAYRRLYYTIQGKDYYQFAFDRINKASNVEFIQTEIIDSLPDGSVVTKRGSFKGDWVFKSYFSKADIPQDHKASFVWQHFKGRVIETDKPHFDPNEVTLMDFRISDKESTKFFYVLPFSEKSALVEYTEFSKDILQQDAYDTLLEDYIKNRMGIQQYRIIEEECDAIPMTDYDFGNPLNGKVLTIGTMAGYVKPSSGYCFTRTLERNKILVEMLKSQAGIQPKRLTSAMNFQWYEDVFLVR